MILSVYTFISNGMPMIVHKQDRQFKQSVGGVRGNIQKMVKLPE